MNDEEELVFAYENAWSFPGSSPPVGSVFIGIMKTENNEYSFYKDKEGNYFYQSSRTMKIEKELADAAKKRKQKNRSVLEERSCKCQQNS